MHLYIIEIKSLMNILNSILQKELSRVRMKIETHCTTVRQSTASVISLGDMVEGSPRLGDNRGSLINEANNKLENVK